MTFKASLKCDAFGCCNEVELECFDPANSEDAVFSLADDSGWFVDSSACDHYCPEHAQEAKAEYEESTPTPTGIHPTMVG